MRTLATAIWRQTVRTAILLHDVLVMKIVCTDISYGNHKPALICFIPKDANNAIIVLIVWTVYDANTVNSVNNVVFVLVVSDLWGSRTVFLINNILKKNISRLRLNLILPKSFSNVSRWNRVWSNLDASL